MSNYAQPDVELKIHVWDEFFVAFLSHQLCKYFCIFSTIFTHKKSGSLVDYYP